jgi:diguanylate cyclase (GGDEF)-like protein/PAS domain S-box-containing protein
VRQTLLARRQGRGGWTKLLAASEPWGRLRFLDHASSPEDPTDILSWIPDIPISEDPDAWHPEDALFAELESSSGELLGMLSVDMPIDGMRPGPATRHALEAFAVTASLAIQHAALAAESRRGARRFQAIFDSSPVAIALLGPDRRITGVNDALCRFLGRDRDALLGHLPYEFTHGADLEASKRASDLVWAAVPGPRSSAHAPVERRYVLPDGSTVWGLLHLAPLNVGDEPGMIIAQIEDITERKRAEDRLVQQAHYDALTSLPNRPQSMARLASALLRDADRGTMTAVFFCDLDRLKLVNDGHGHAVGDAYIVEVSRRIRAAVRESDVVGRLSGDEFVVILEGLASPTESIGLAGRIIEAVREPLHLGGAQFTPSLSLGIAYAGRGDATADELLAQADSAMYRAKLEDRGGWQVYDPTMSNSAAARLRLRTDVAEALDQGQFVLHYQPIVRLADHAVTGHEALLRWQHPRHGLLMPSQFLDVVLDSEYESPVTDWVISRACQDAMLRPSGARRVSVNVSSHQVGRRELPAVIARCLHQTGLDPRDLVLELTEDRLLSRADGAERLEALHALGVVLAIDDFGTGYAGLGYLQRFAALDIVKLDRSFVARLGFDQVSSNIVQAMVDLARGCGLLLVTEGVETEEQEVRLAALGVELAQGYRFGRPLPLVESLAAASPRGEERAAG